MIGEILELSRPFVAAEAWRLWTAHLVHYDAEHLLFNVVAIIPPVMLMGKENLRRVVIWWIICSPLLSALLFFDPSWTAVRGASGLAVGLWIFAPLVCRERSRRGIIVAMLTLVALKIIAETVSGWTVSNLENPPLVSAHWFGAILGLLSAAIVREGAPSRQTPASARGFRVRQNPVRRRKLPAFPVRPRAIAYSPRSASPSTRRFSRAIESAITRRGS